MRSSANIVIGLFLGLGITAPALAATVSIYADKQDWATTNTVAVAGYRIGNANWDQVLGNGAVKPSQKDLTTAELGNASQLNGTLWDFSVNYESGDNAARGFTFSMSQRDVARPVGAVNTLTGRSRPVKPFESTLLFDAKHPLSEGFPEAAFNAIDFEVRAGGLPEDISKALVKVSKLNFYAGRETTSLKDLTASSSSRGSEWSSYWVTSNTDLSTVDWRISGVVQGRFRCADGTPSCLGDDSISMNMRFAEVSTVPVPAAAWLFITALGALGLRRRKQQV